MKAVRENAAAGGWGFDLCQKICPKYQFKLWFNFGPVLFRILDCVPQVCQHWCQFAVRSVNIFKRPPQDKAAQCDAVSLCQWHRSIALEHGRLNTAGDAGEKWDGNGHGRGGHQCVIHRRVCFHTCNVWVCEVLRCVCVTLLRLQQSAELISSTGCLPATLWVRASTALTSGQTSMSKCFHLWGKWHTFTHTAGHLPITNHHAYKQGWSMKVIGWNSHWGCVYLWGFVCVCVCEHFGCENAL